MAPAKKQVNTEDEKVGQNTHIDIPAEGDVKREDLGESGIDIIQPNALESDYAARLAFMEEPVTIVVHESTDDNAEPVVQLYCNGTPQFIVRGQPQEVKRKYVEILANARQTSIKTETRTQGDDVINRVNKHTALRYPFSVQEDKNPRGAAWLRELLASA